MAPCLRSFTANRLVSHLLKIIGSGLPGAVMPLGMGIGPAAAAITYTTDSFTDGVTGSEIGGGAFELYGIGTFSRAMLTQRHRSFWA